MESLRPEVAPFGIYTTTVESRVLRTAALSPESTNYAAPVDRRLRRAPERAHRRLVRARRQADGDPAKLAAGAYHDRAARCPHAVGSSPAPTRSAPTEQKVAELQADIDLNRERFISLDITQ